MFKASPKEKIPRKTYIGRPFPLGSSLSTKGVNFSIAAPNAKYLELLIFSNFNDNEPEEIIRINPENKSGDYWHIEVEGLSKGCIYGYRVKSKENNLLSEKVLLDPCARSIGGWMEYKRSSAIGTASNLKNCLKGIVTERDLFNFSAHPRPRHPWNKSIIYELHVGGFTRNVDSLISKEKRGTFLGLIEKIPYLTDLGINTIELLPIYTFDPFDAPRGLKNYWGYSPINWFSPHYEYVAGNNPIESRDQFRELVAACHDKNIEVLIDVVYNHTTEGNRDGANISWRGFGESTYYHLNKEKTYLDVTGCGNTIAANNPITRKLIIESLQCWANELGVDGFRFDLGIALSRGKDLDPLDKPPLFEDIESDPILSDLKLVSEPWDCGGLYRLSDFPAKNIGTWNGKFRDEIRRFWKGDKNSTWQLKDRLISNEILYKNNLIKQQRSINFITAHDGFTLHDLVSYDSKKNLANGENNRDGENHNNSYNLGLEGPTTNKDINSLRLQQKKNLLTTLAISYGVPMLLMGDEVGRSQGGNNNSWCQDNELGWMIWDKSSCDLDLHRFLKKLLKIRSQLPNLFNTHLPLPENLTKEQISEDCLWIQWHGIELSKPDWESWSHTISYSINQGHDGAVMWIGFNAYFKNMSFALPKPVNGWLKLINTANPSSKDIELETIDDSQTKINLKKRSLVLILDSALASKLTL